jgi:hypothetical protein
VRLANDHKRHCRNDLQGVSMFFDDWIHMVDVRWDGR